MWGDIYIPELRERGIVINSVHTLFCFLASFRPPFVARLVQSWGKASRERHHHSMHEFRDRPKSDWDLLTALDCLGRSNRPVVAGRQVEAVA